MESTFRTDPMLPGLLTGALVGTDPTGRVSEYRVPFWFEARV